jgi:hypothetical protein
LVEVKDKFIGDISNRQDIDRYLLRYVNSFHGKTISKAAKGSSKTGLLLRQAKSEDVNSIIDSMHAVLEMISISDTRNTLLPESKHDFQGPTVTSLNTDMDLNKRYKSSLNATLPATSYDEKAFKAIDKAYQSEMLAILIDTAVGNRISRAYLNCLNTEFQTTGSYLTYVNDMEWDAEFVKTMQDSLMFSKDALTKQAENQNK